MKSWHGMAFVSTYIRALTFSLMNQSFQAAATQQVNKILRTLPTTGGLVCSGEYCSGGRSAGCVSETALLSAELSRLDASNGSGSIGKLINESDRRYRQVAEKWHARPLSSDFRCPMASLRKSDPDSRPSYVRYNW